MNTRVLFAGLCILLLTAGMGVGLAAGQADTATGTTTAPASSITVASGLSETNGTQTVIVRLTEQPERAISATSHDNRIGALKTHAAVTQSPFERFAEGNPHVEIERSFWLTNALVVTVDTDHVPLERLGMVDNVEAIHPNHEVTTATTTAAPATATHAVQPRTQQTTGTPTQQVTTATETTAGLQRVNVSGAWAYTRGANASIAVLDSGVDPDHPDIDIDPAHWNDWYPNGTSRDTAPQDYGKHGTHVTGIAVGGNASGTHIGVAPKATLYAGAALNQDCNTKCSGTIAQLLAGMQWAVKENVDVISLSVGGIEENDNYIDRTVDAVRNAEAAGTVVVAAAGNSGSGNTTSPGNVYDAISVGATTGDDTVADFSSSAVVRADAWDDPPADWPETYSVPTVVAPGVGVKSSVPDGEYTRFSGTSQATPHVAGTVALMRAASHEQLSPDKIESILESTAVEVDAEQTRQGAGRIDAAAAVARVAAQPNITVNITAAPDRVRVGDTLTVAYTATNTGDAAGNTTLDFRVNGSVVATNTTETLEPGEQSTGAFSYQPDYNETGALTVTVRSDAGSDSRVITVVKPQVRLSDVQFTPEQVTQTVTTHTLNVTVRNVSDDGQPDTFTVTLPDQVTISNETVSAVDAAGMSVPVSDITVTNETDLTFVVSPDSEALIRNVTVTAEFDALASG